MKILLLSAYYKPDKTSSAHFSEDLRKALANPDEDFVVIAPAVVAKTRIIGGEELEEIQNYAENADLDSENVYASQEEEYEEEYDDSYNDYDYDDYDDEEEEKGVLNPKLDKLVNVALIAIAVLIIGIIIWLGASVMNLFNQPGNTQKPPKPSSEVESTQTETGTDKNTETTQKPTEEKELVTMVNIVGWNVKQAEEYLKALGLKLNVIANQESTEPVGTILHQNEAAGNKVEKGKIINVVVSGENESQELKPVPNLVGYTKEIAQALLQAAGFTEPVEVEYGYHEDLTKVGLVVSQTPAAGTRHKETTVIVIVISEGRAPVLVPNNLAEKDLSVAKFKLEDELGFVVVVREEYSENVAKGLVISVQGAGTEVAYGSELEVVISKGKAPASTEDTEEPGKAQVSINKEMVGTDAKELKETLELLGLTVVEKQGTDKVAKGLVEDIKVNGKSVVGSKVAEGATVEIYVGTGAATSTEDPSEDPSQKPSEGDSSSEGNNSQESSESGSSQDSQSSSDEGTGVSDDVTNEPTE